MRRAEVSAEVNRALHPKCTDLSMYEFGAERLTSWVTLGKFLNLSEPQCPHP